VPAPGSKAPGRARLARRAGVGGRAGYAALVARVAVVAVVAPLGLGRVALAQAPAGASGGPPASGGGEADADLEVAGAPRFVDPHFGPRYVIEQIVVRGNRKTQTSLILGEMGLQPGDALGASDPAVEAARYRLLALGHFLDVRLSVERGSRRGAVTLLVEVEERGTLVLNELFASTSSATAFWGGVDLSETNFLGRGINLGAGFVASTRPLVPEAVAGLGLRLHGATPERRGPGRLGFSASGLFSDGSEFARVLGGDEDGNPSDFLALRTRRVGGTVGVNRTLSRAWRGSLDFREEFVRTTLPADGLRVLPNGAVTTFDLDARGGSTRVGTLAATLDYDTRSDPILPRSGMRFVASLEAGGPALGGSYTFAKALVQASLYARMPHGHALGLHLLGGAITGDAPYFDQFFVGDLNLLLPRRALGLNFSTLPSRNLLGTTIARHRYDDYAARVLLEYVVPIWRRHGFVYGGDAFAAAGLLGMASDGDLDPPGPFRWSALPVDLTADLGLRFDTVVGIFTISIANALSRSSF
jgi:outer membrane protein insertion porin family